MCEKQSHLGCMLGERQLTRTCCASGSGVPPGAPEVAQGADSGFIWDTAGHVVTNFHVIVSTVADSERTLPLDS
jgi:S1-C subfamily serine protease